MRRALSTPLGRYIFRGLLLAAVCGLFLLLDSFGLFDGILICPLHLLGLYCPTCGMTRAMHALLRLDLALMLRCHPLSPLLLLVALYYGVHGLVASCRGENAPLSGARRWPIYLLIALLFAFFILRNVLLLAFSCDPLGDMLPAQ